ncbi:MAG: 2-amino-4-hydroxy-6-hydroxymethyldihydropteridine diphosphokinase [gamma proteobacterium symbiont of Ctena orbiculata]|uniref:2-amino-4-hydroxy-6-hydroxymethyldihydropteridine pyrophosphokinase n=1 Tax=Candidatus Thiodiazotropha taylori TaxID=2792791 RepID=A0A944QWV3_9GAMM|nr:2-amino-4-hydroxy-6-hydroxymethyldihydropteridine diphosphokinase [Candidatus Thiodiazotropha taylori]PUB87421.1 MAG: 2-amino-4-hydroxy-6-hydroxymethyldihydropteridine diphosphokinase [gamma proteobacterium symbiont of Ctena orbiculata]MBT2990676.1 2-amino-4-hydroxy-6-hydroxymethyldihydropteridine diphosphokinase [Candidatus Thiodiazotropha taylori]MBT2996840.1 2-amino-4-hydroxy-6-hydroxymethyldihydropteridine diphosphokinase [Candidatus Thiodiazotropha taylori]MBT3002073.1 2-amino-4-hydroxy
MSRDRSLTAYVGLGSNMENPRRQVESALEELKALRPITLLKHSSLYRTRPLGPQNQPYFINAVASLATTLDAEALLDQLQALEQAHRRERGGLHWGPRTLDLDLLLYGGMSIDTPRLSVPHPEMAKRAFVLLPMSEIAPPDMEIPGMGRLQDLLLKLSGEGIERVDR